MRLKQESDHAEAQRWVDSYIAAGGFVSKVDRRGKIAMVCPNCQHTRQADARAVALGFRVQCSRCGTRMRAS